jgi:hypothetical protein
MFDEFEQSGKGREGRGRRSLSAVLSGVIFGALALGVGGAVTAHQVNKRRAERDAEVTFEQLPKVQAPKPKPLVQAPSPSQRKPVARKPIVAPKQIPKETPDEAEGQLAETEAPGPVDGVVGEGGPAVAEAPPPPLPPPTPPPPRPPPATPAPEQQRETIERPKFVSGCRAPAIPDALHKAAATIQIDVLLVVGTNGRVASAKVVQSHPLVADELVLACARSQLFEPAHLPDGTAVPYPFKRRFVFRPTQA